MSLGALAALLVQHCSAHQSSATDSSKMSLGFFGQKYRQVEMTYDRNRLHLRTDANKDLYIVAVDDRFEMCFSANEQYKECTFREVLQAVLQALRDLEINVLQAILQALRDLEINVL